MTSLIQDFKYGLRRLRSEPGFSLAAVLTLALGIGASTAVFSLVDGILLRPLPYGDPDRIVTVWQSSAKAGVVRDKVSPANFLDWQEQNRAFSAMAAAEPYGFDLRGDAEPERISGWLVTAEFFPVLGTRALAGNTFHAGQAHRPGGAGAVVLSHGLWQRRFGSDPAVVGSTLWLSGDPYTVTGVMPPAFRFPQEDQGDLWALREFEGEERQLRRRSNLLVVARLASGVSVERAQQEMEAVAARLARQFPEDNEGVGATMVPLSEQLFGDVRPALNVLFAAVVFVLLITCANVSGLLLARGVRRQREIASRAALGATQGRLARQLFLETLLLALSGGALGVLLAYWGIRAMVALAPADLPRIDQVGLDGRVLAFAFAVSLATVLIAGLTPLLQVSRTELLESLAEGGRGATSGHSHRGLRGAVVVAELAFALMLLIGAGLLLRSFTKLLAIDPGFAPERVAILEVHVWGRQHTPEQRAAFLAETLERISSVPGAQAAGAVSSLPFFEGRIDAEVPFEIEGRPPFPAGQEPVVYQTVATPGYHDAMGIPLLRGRPINRFDSARAGQVALINETMARRHWPTGDPVGARIVLSSFGPPVSRQIVGVVGDVRHAGLDSDPRPEVYVPHAQSPFGSMAYAVRTTGDPSVLLPDVKKAIWSVDGEQTFSSTATLDGLVSETMAQRRFSLLVLGLFSAVALVLSIIGIYSLISFSTRRRTQEIGIRIALGAQSGDILRMVMREGMFLIGVGVVAGAAGALVLTRFLESLLYDVAPADPLTFVGVSIVLSAIALLASYVPARMATRLDPVRALRLE